MVTEKELMAAMSSVVLNMAVKVVDWTTTIDDRCIPATIGFFFELAGNQGVHGSRRIRSLAHETCFFFHSSWAWASQSPILHSYRNIYSTS